MKNWAYSTNYQDSYALVIGINSYHHVGPLSIARNDAESIVETLVQDLGFPQNHITVLLDSHATKAQIMRQFLAYESLQPDDRLIIFFAGHGATVSGHKGAIGYLIPVDGKIDEKDTLIRWDDLTKNSDIIPAKHVLFIMDACYSGLAIHRSSASEKRFVSEMLQRRSRQVITAGKADEPVSDGGGPTGNNSIFTGHLIEGLKGKAANEEGILTASYLMNYVYQKVSTDPSSNQTPHFGHLDGDGDLIFRTPHDEHTKGLVDCDFLIKPVVERPEITTQPIASQTIKPTFLERNGYENPDSEFFGKNEFSGKLGLLEWAGESGNDLVRPECWLSIVAEPISRSPISLDIGELAKKLPSFSLQGQHPYEQLRCPSQSLTTAKSAILFDADYNRNNLGKDCWKRFLRIEKTGCIEYCSFPAISGNFATNPPEKGVKIFRYVQLIGVVWSILYVTKHILNIANYHSGVRYTVNMIGTKDSILCDFSYTPGKDNSPWLQPFQTQAKMGGSLHNWKCRDLNLQISFQVVMGSLTQSTSKKIIVDCADQLGLAYNHKSTPRCFNYGTDIYPWSEFNAGDI